MCVTGFGIIEDSALFCDFVMSISECEMAAQELSLSVMSAVEVDSAYNAYPPFCFLLAGSLYFSTANTGPCSTIAKCICRQNYFCSKIPCDEGQGDCNDNTECEGSLVCGHMNCANSSITDCCTHTCNNDTDCTSGECNVETNQCRLNSNTIDWSKCGQGSKCADGEGDCDHHSDCEGYLLCGSDNCASGPMGMDCCTRPCHNDTDCLNQECITDISQCHLDSYSTDWSRCSQASQCADGEGDCDLHADCGGMLLCGNDNCANGPKGMDCCTDNGKSVFSC